MLSVNNHIFKTSVHLLITCFFTSSLWFYSFDRLSTTPTQTTWRLCILNPKTRRLLFGLTSTVQITTPSLWTRTAGLRQPWTSRTCDQSLKSACRPTHMLSSSCQRIFIYTRHKKMVPKKKTHTFKTINLFCFCLLVMLVMLLSVNLSFTRFVLHLSFLKLQVKLHSCHLF